MACERSLTSYLVGSFLLLFFSFQIELLRYNIGILLKPSMENGRPKVGILKGRVNNTEYR